MTTAMRTGTQVAVTQVAVGIARARSRRWPVLDLLLATVVLASIFVATAFVASMGASFDQGAPATGPILQPQPGLDL
jgi:hypothetical protein